MSAEISSINSEILELHYSARPSGEGWEIYEIESGDIVLEVKKVLQVRTAIIALELALRSRHIRKIGREVDILLDL